MKEKYIKLKTDKGKKVKTPNNVGPCHPVFTCKHKLYTHKVTIRRVDRGNDETDRNVRKQRYR